MFSSRPMMRASRPATSTAWAAETGSPEASAGLAAGSVQEQREWAAPRVDQQRGEQHEQVENREPEQRLCRSGVALAPHAQRERREGGAGTERDHSVGWTGMAEQPGEGAER